MKLGHSACIYAIFGYFDLMPLNKFLWSILFAALLLAIYVKNVHIYNNSFITSNIVNNQWCLKKKTVIFLQSYFIFNKIHMVIDFYDESVKIFLFVFILWFIKFKIKHHIFYVILREY